MAYETCETIEEAPASTALAYDVVEPLVGDRVDYGDKDPADMTDEEYAWWAYDNKTPLWAIRVNLLTRTPCVLSGLNPSSAAIGDPSFRLYVSGTGFIKDGSVIVFAGQDENTQFEEDGTLSTGVNMDYWHGADVIPVMVRNMGVYSEPLDFTFTAAGAPLEASDPDDLEDEIEASKADGDFKSKLRGRSRK